MSNRAMLTLAILFVLPITKIFGQATASYNSLAMGNVIGTITTYEGKPASGYTVDIIGAGRTSTGRVRVQTSDEGRFSASRLKYGDYVIAPYLEGVDSRYPGGSSSFYEPNPIRFQINEANPNKQLNVTLRAPNRILSGSISSFDGSPISSVIEIEVPSDPDRFIRFSSTAAGLFRVLIPSKTALIIKVTAEGYVQTTQALSAVDENTDPQIDLKLRRAAGD